MWSSQVFQKPYGAIMSLMLNATMEPQWNASASSPWFDYIDSPPSKLAAAAVDDEGDIHVDRAGRPHPRGYMEFTNTKVSCTNCTIATIDVTTLTECQARCNTTCCQRLKPCRAITMQTAPSGSKRSCALLTALSPGTGAPGYDTYVRVPDPFYGRHRL
jgi:hypothetical protein